MSITLSLRDLLFSGTAVLRMNHVGRAHFPSRVGPALVQRGPCLRNDPGPRACRTERLASDQVGGTARRENETTQRPRLAGGGLMRDDPRNGVGGGVSLDEALAAAPVWFGAVGLGLGDTRRARTNALWTW